MADKEINIVIKAIDQATNGIKKVGSEISGRAKKNEDTFKGMAVAGGIAFGAITAIAKTSIDAFAESEAQMVRVSQAIKNIDMATLGSTFAEANQKAIEFGNSMQSMAGIGGEIASESFAKLLAVTKDYSLATKAATLAVDLSVAKQMDMDSATKVVTMAMAGNVKILKEYGITLADNATKEEIMGAIMEKVGGQAAAFGQTTAGQMAILKESFGDVQEAIGGALAPALTSLVSVVQPLITSIAEWIAQNPTLAGNIILIAGGIAGLVAVMGTLGLILPAIVAGFTFMLGPVGLIILGITALIALGVAIYMNWSLLVAKIQELGLRFLDLYDKYQVVFMIFAPLIALGVELYQNWDMIMLKAGELWAKIQLIWTNIKLFMTTTITSIATTVTGIWTGMLNGMQSAVTSVFDWIVGKFNAIVSTVTNAVAKLKALWADVTGGGGGSSGKRALGGTVQAGKSYMVGERGPEMFTPATTGKIDPNPGSGGGGGVVINMGGVVVNNEADENRLVQKISEELKRQNQLYSLGIN